MLAKTEATRSADSGARKPNEVVALAVAGSATCSANTALTPLPRRDACEADCTANEDDDEEAVTIDIPNKHLQHDLNALVPELTPYTFKFASTHCCAVAHVYVVGAGNAQTFGVVGHHGELDRLVDVEAMKVVNRLTVAKLPTPRGAFVVVLLQANCVTYDWSLKAGFVMLVTHWAVMVTCTTLGAVQPSETV